MRPNQLVSVYLNEDQPASGGGGPVTLAGDVTGPSGANSVVKVQNISWSNAVPGFGQVPVYSGSWQFQTPNFPWTAFVPGASANVTPPQAGATNTDNVSACQMQFFNRSGNSGMRATTATFNFQITVVASGAFDCRFDGILPPLGVYNAIDVVLCHTGAGPTSLCTPMKATVVIQNGNTTVRVFGTTGAGLPLGPYSGTATMNYRY